MEDIVRKEELACYKQFILFHNVFHSYISLMHQNASLCGNGLTWFHCTSKFKVTLIFTLSQTTNFRLFQTEGVC